MPAHSPSPLYHPSLALAALVLAACSVSGKQSFEQAFPDPSELITTPSPAAAHRRLADTELPATREHSERLLALLRGTSGITAAHLALLTRAVGHESHSVCNTGGDSWCWGQRGKGDAATTIELLLNDGLPKITTIDRRWYGELVGMSQTDPTLRRYVDRFHAQLDDGSAAALREILGGMPGSPAATAFFGALFDTGKIDGERAWIAFGELSFDEQRTDMLRLMIDRGIAANGDQLLTTMRAFSFDSGRESAFRMLLGKAGALSFADAKAVIGMFSFDDGRQAACAALSNTSTLQLDDAELATLLRLFSFDSGRAECVRALAPHLRGEPTAEGARAVLATFSFDSDRLQATKAMAGRWRTLSKDDRMNLLSTFSFDSSRKDATYLLMN